MNRINVAAKQVTRALPAHGLHLAGSAAHCSAHSPRKQSKTLESRPKCQKVSKNVKKNNKNQQNVVQYVSKTCTNLIACRLVSTTLDDSKAFRLRKPRKPRPLQSTMI